MDATQQKLYGEIIARHQGLARKFRTAGDEESATQQDRLANHYASTVRQLVLEDIRANARPQTWRKRKDHTQHDPTPTQQAVA